jgi:hypothetical protein
MMNSVDVLFEEDPKPATEHAATFNRFLARAKALTLDKKIAIASFAVILIAIAVYLMFIGRQDQYPNGTKAVADAVNGYLSSNGTTHNATRAAIQEFVDRTGGNFEQTLNETKALLPINDDGMFGAGRGQRKKRLTHRGGTALVPNNLRHPALTAIMKRHYDANFLPAMMKAAENMSNVPGIGTCGQALKESVLKVRTRFFQALLNQVKVSDANRERFDNDPDGLMRDTVKKVLQQPNSSAYPELTQCAKEAVEWGAQVKNGKLSEDDFIYKLIASAEHHVQMSNTTAQRELGLPLSRPHAPMDGSIPLLNTKVFYYISYALLAVMMANLAWRGARSIFSRIMRLFPKKVAEVVEHERSPSPLAPKSPSPLAPKSPSPLAPKSPSPKSKPKPQKKKTTSKKTRKKPTL